jgi:hypothetical protein
VQCGSDRRRSVSIWPIDYLLFMSLTADFGEWVRRTKARRRFRRAAVTAALAVTSSEAERLRESSNEVLSIPLLAPLPLSIAASMERYREAATAVPLQSSAAETVVVALLAVIIVVGSSAGASMHFGESVFCVRDYFSRQNLWMALLLDRGLRICFRIAPISINNNNAALLASFSLIATKDL